MKHGGSDKCPQINVRASRVLFGSERVKVIFNEEKFGYTFLCSCPNSQSLVPLLISVTIKEAYVCS